MVDISYEPFKKIIVKTYSKMALDSFLSSIDSVNDPGQKGFAGYVSWANGIIFSIFFPPASELSLGEYVNGTLFVDNIMFAPLEEYNKIINVRKDGSLIITVYDESESTLYNPLTKWIKETLM
ncbi:MAG: hypothetical protein M1476_02665 [Candidatus Thermoplasmatota archaeon]|nr:hypothetical protein [Candidatus Thermoplasmatota archaeon]